MEEAADHNLNSKSSPCDTHFGRTPENIAAVKAVLDADADKPADDPGINTCRRNILGLNPSTWSRIATKDLSYHSYKMERSQGLKPEDLPRRMRFADTFVNLSRREMANIVYSDDATISLDGEVNIRRYAPMLKMYCHQSKWGDSH